MDRIMDKDQIELVEQIEDLFDKHPLIGIEDDFKTELKKLIPLTITNYTHNASFGESILGYHWSLFGSSPSDLRCVEDIDKAQAYIEGMLYISKKVKKHVTFATTMPKDALSLRLSEGLLTWKYLSGWGIQTSHIRLRVLEHEKEIRKSKKLNQIKKEIRDMIETDKSGFTLASDFGEKVLNYPWNLFFQDPEKLRSINDINKTIDYLKKLLHVSEEIKNKIPDAILNDTSIVLFLSDNPSENNGWYYFSDSVRESIKDRIIDLEEERKKRKPQPRDKKIHNIKCEPESFSDIEYGLKNFEIRKNDRDYRQGDYVVLREYDGEYTGRTLFRAITYVWHGGKYGLSKGYCVFQMSNADPHDLENMEQCCVWHIPR